MYEIKLKINDEADLYNPLDPDCVLLSEDVSSYLNRKLSEKNFDPLEKNVIHIISSVPLDEERVRKNIVSYTESELKILSKKKKRSVIKQLWLFLLGVIFIALWLFLDSITENVIATVVCIVGWFAVWEAANIWLVENPEMRVRKLVLQRMEKTEIVFSLEPNEERNEQE